MTRVPAPPLLHSISFCRLSFSRSNRHAPTVPSSESIFSTHTHGVFVKLKARKSTIPTPNKRQTSDGKCR